MFGSVLNTGQVGYYPDEWESHRCFCFLRYQGKKESAQRYAQNLLKLGLTKQYTYAILKQITDTGPRLAGSPQAAAAVELTQQLMLEFGFESVHLEPTTVPHWIRGGTAEARLLSIYIRPSTPFHCSHRGKHRHTREWISGSGCRGSKLSRTPGSLERRPGERSYFSTGLWILLF